MEEILKYTHFTIDSREVNEGSVFIALTTGERDGNNFAKSAFIKKAGFLILSKKPQFEIPKSNYIVVEDTLKFITELSKLKFNLLKNSGVKSIAITGSMGKTTTKEFLLFLLKKAKKNVFGTAGNLNNHIGVPLTILNSPFNIDFLILEMGMNMPKEISNLISIAPTDIRIITNISKAHIGNFDEGLYGIFKAKTEILENSDPHTILITNFSLPFLNEIQDTFKGKINLVENITEYNTKNNQTYFTCYGKTFAIAKIVTIEWLSLITLGFKVLEFLQIPIPASIIKFLPPNGRGNESTLKNGTILIDESYNANPESMKNAIKALSFYDGKKLMVIGAMKELGTFEEKEHLELYHFIQSFKEIDKIFIGQEFSFLQNKEKWFLNVEKLCMEDLTFFLNYDVILVKASNSVNLSKLFWYT